MQPEIVHYIIQNDGVLKKKILDQIPATLLEI